MVDDRSLLPYGQGQGRSGR